MKEQNDLEEHIQSIGETSADNAGIGLQVHLVNQRRPEEDVDNSSDDLDGLEPWFNDRIGLQKHLKNHSKPQNEEDNSSDDLAD